MNFSCLKFNNAIVVVGNQEFPIRKDFLASHSAYFQEKFSKNPEEDLFIIDSSIDAPKFQMLLKHLYDEIVITEHNVSDLLEASAFFQAKNVLKNAMGFLISMPNEQFPIVKKLIIADKLGIPDLLDIVLNQYFALEEPPFFSGILSQPLRPATAFRVMERATKQQKAPESKERLLKAEAQGPETLIQEKALQMILEAVDFPNPHIPMIRTLCGLNLNAETEWKQHLQREADNKLILRLQEMFSLPNCAVADQNDFYRRHMHQLRTLEALRDKTRQAGGLDDQDWEGAIDRRVREVEYRCFGDRRGKNQSDEQKRAFFKYQREDSNRLRELLDDY